MDGPIFSTWVGLDQIMRTTPSLTIILLASCILCGRQDGKIFQEHSQWNLGKTQISKWHAFWKINLQMSRAAMYIMKYQDKGMINAQSFIGEQTNLSNLYNSFSKWLDPLF